MIDFDQLRKEYQNQRISAELLDPDPFQQFESWFDVAVRHCPGRWFEPNAMTISTSDGKGLVTSRTVLLKHFDSVGLYFFTHYDSEKGQQIQACPHVSLLFHWPYLGRQIRIEGRAAMTSRQVSEKYFHSRPRGAQLSACISEQSHVVASREELESRRRELEIQLTDQLVPLPERWGGFVVVPNKWEFWQGSEDRLHDRIEYVPAGDGQWTRQRLAP